MSGKLGLKTLSVEQQNRVLEMLRSGETQDAVANRLGVTKNTIAGVWHRRGEPVHQSGIEPTTLYDRCDAMHAKLDAVLAATMGVGRIPEPERTPLRSAGR